MTAGRASGILLHPTSLPGEGCGDFGAGAFRFIDWLAQAGQRYWQVLPLTPPGPGHSPYMSASTHAGNPVLISIDRLIEAWLPMTVALNSLNRSMGQPDLYPFALTPPAIEKLRFIQDLVASSGAR